VPLAWALIASRIEKLGAKPVLRRDKQGNPALTDEENFILDCHFGRIEKPAELALTIRSMPGVIDQGLFINYPDLVILGAGEGVERFEVKRTVPRQSP
jgi:ribose 5-phosphate isomerase A